MMRDHQQLLGQQCREFYSAVAQVLLDTDPRLYQLALLHWRVEQGKQRSVQSKAGRAKRIIERLNSLRQPD